MKIRTLQDLMSLVAARRRELAWSQAELASHAGVSRRWVSMFESGHEKAEVGRVLAVLDALGVSLMTDSEGITEVPAEATDLRAALGDYYADEA
jgi:HTH-type transcriptional regulator/antitoxin HipB